jgi:flavin-binding protein dodecin
MSDQVYKLVEVVGTSSQGTDDAIRNAITTAGKTIRNLDWFEVVKTTAMYWTARLPTSRSP